jgi:dTDP-4-amino-4,6-dideoxygalactose transaminase
MYFRRLPPAASPLTLSDIRLGYRAARATDSPIERFKSAICKEFGVRHSFLVSSGKAALTLVLSLLAQLSERRQVVIPAFSSFCLPSAVAKAGLQIVLCDISSDTLDFDLNQLEAAITEETLCVIPVHLFGLVAQMDDICRLAARQGAFVLEDAAQAAGGSLRGGKLGTLGNVGVFSLGRGKNITAVNGGVIVTNSDYLGLQLHKQIEELHGARRSPRSGSVTDVLQGLALACLVQPRFYWLPHLLPFLKLGASEFSTAFQIAPYRASLAGIGVSVLSRLSHYTAIRRQNAAYLLRHLPVSRRFMIPRPIQESSPVYLRLPVLVRDPLLRQQLYDTLCQQGLGVSTTYPTALSAIPEIAPCVHSTCRRFPNAEFVARSILTLPTHPYTTRHDLDRIVAAFRAHA